MNGNTRVAILLEAESAFDRQLLRGIGQYSRGHGPWSFRVVADRLEGLKPPAGLWGASCVIGRVPSPEILETFKMAGVPVVAVDTISASSERRPGKLLARTGIDMNAIARLAADHFGSNGFQRMAFVTASHRNWSDCPYEFTKDATMRFEQPYFLSPAESYSGRAGKLHSSSLLKWLVQLPKPIGIVAFDDERGIQVLEACHHAQIKFPSEVAVLGVGNDELLCSLATPSLLSVALAAVEGGFRTARALNSLMQGIMPLSEQILIQPESLVVRSSTDIDVSRDPYVSAARSIIPGHSLRHFSISALAKSVGISRRTLELRFRKYAGRTIFDEIQEARLSKAKVILKETELPISRVAASAGYRSVAYFIRVFGKEIGLTPAKYRAASRVTEIRRNSSQGIWKLAE